MERITRLSKGAWLEFLEEIQYIMEGFKIADQDLIDEFKFEYPDYSYGLIRSAVKTSRQFLDLSNKILRLITDDINFFGLTTKKIIEAACKATGNDNYPLIAAIVYKSLGEITTVHANALVGYFHAERLTGSAETVADDIIKSFFKYDHQEERRDNRNAFNMLTEAVRNRQAVLRKAEMEREEKIRREQNEERLRRKEKKWREKSSRDGKIKEILNRPRVPIRYSNGAASSAISLNGENEVAIMKSGTKIILEGEIFEIEKSSGGQVKKRFIDGAKVIETEKPASLTTETLSLAAKKANIEKATPHLTLTKNAIWVVFQNKLMKLIVAPEDINGNAAALSVKPGTLIVTEKTLKVFEVDKKGLIYAGKAEKPAKKPSEEERHIALSTG